MATRSAIFGFIRVKTVSRDMGHGNSERILEVSLVVKLLLELLSLQLLILIIKTRYLLNSQKTFHRTMNETESDARGWCPRGSWCPTQTVHSANVLCV